MNNRNKSIIILGNILGFCGPLARLSVLGWFALFGIFSVILFGTLHLILMNRIVARYEQMDQKTKIAAWASVLLYPIIFLFQFDFGDGPGTFYVYEIITGNFNSSFENYAIYIALAAGLLYLTLFTLIFTRKNKAFKVLPKS